MENYRKSTILEKIIDYTRASVLDGSLSFEQCNALNLALDLKMDRSNVSRILNQLFNELLLIKINGRPTIFISRDVLSEEFPYAKIPQIVPSLSALKEHLHPGSTDEYKASAKDFDIIGNLPREALKETVDKLLPVLLCPPREPLLFIVTGEKGCGKKHFCEQLFRYSQEKNIFPPGSRSFTCAYHEIQLNLLRFLEQLDPQQTAMILIEVHDELLPDTIYSLKNDIASLYKNASCRPPALFFLFDREISNLQEFSSLTPCIVRFPSLDERTPLEKIKLILTFVQEAADFNNIQIHMGSDVIVSLLSTNYSYNIYELKNEINYALSHCIYLSGSSPVHLSLESFSENIVRPRHKKDLQTREAALIVEQSIPAFVDFYPQTPCSVLDYLTNSQVSSLMALKPRHFLQDIARRDVLETDTSLDAQPFTEEQAPLFRIQYLIKTALAKTVLRFDAALSRRLTEILDSMVRGAFHIENASLKTDFICSPAALELADTIIDRIELQHAREFSAENKAYIQAFLHYALLGLQKSTIVYVLVLHQPQMARNYAHYMNYVTETRSFYTLDYTEEDAESFDRYARRQINLFRQLDMSKEFLILCDREPLTSLAQQISASVNLVALSLNPVNLSLLNRIYTVSRSQNIHAVSMFRKLLNERKKEQAELERVVSRYPDNYILSILGSQFDSFFELNNTILANKLLFDILKDICSRLGLFTSARLVLDFLLHGNFLISRSIQKLPLAVRFSDKLLEQYSMVYELVEKKLLQPRELGSLNISRQEIYVIFLLLLEYLNE